VVQDQKIRLLDGVRTRNETQQQKWNVAKMERSNKSGTWQQMVTQQPKGMRHSGTLQQKRNMAKVKPRNKSRTRKKLITATTVVYGKSGNRQQKLNAAKIEMHKTGMWQKERSNKNGLQAKKYMKG
jgi:hypothetical protein